MDKLIELIPQIVGIVEDILIIVAFVAALIAKKDAKRALNNETIDKVKKAVKIKNTKSKDKVLKILQQFSKEDVAEIIKNYMEVKTDEEKKASGK